VLGNLPSALVADLPDAESRTARAARRWHLDRATRASASDRLNAAGARADESRSAGVATGGCGGALHEHRRLPAGVAPRPWPAWLRRRARIGVAASRPRRPGSLAKPASI